MIGKNNMTVQLKDIIEKERNLAIQTNDVKQLVKTLALSIDRSLMHGDDCYYLEALIKILRNKTISLNGATEKLYSKLIKYKIVQNQI